MGSFSIKSWQIQVFQITSERNSYDSTIIKNFTKDTQLGVTFHHFVTVVLKYTTSKTKANTGILQKEYQHAPSSPMQSSGKSIKSLHSDKFVSNMHTI